MSKASSPMRVLLLGGVVGPAFFTTAVLIAAALRPDYDHSMQVMSALGATGSPNSLVMNGLGFLPTGILIAVFGFALHRLGPRSSLSHAGGLLLILFAGGIVGAGAYSCDSSCLGVGTTREAFLHIVASVIAFLSGIAACFAWGGAFRTSPAWRPLSNFSFLTGLVAGSLLYAFNTTSGTASFPGIWQRLFIGSLFSWCAVVGVLSYRLTDPARQHL